MRTSLHVLLVGPDADAIGEATLALAGAGHTVSHVTAESGVPFRWPTGDRHSFDPDTVDVVVSIPGHALVGVPWCEERVLTLTESGVPLVLAGTPLASPYTAWATSYTSPGADLVLVVEDAVRQRAAQADVLPEHDHDDHVSRTVFDPIDFEQSGGEPLTRARCLALLGTAKVGRIGFTAGALPVVVPVDYRLWRDRVVFRTAEGSRLHTATTDAVVAFEVDALGADEPWGWSVTVTGVARDVSGLVDAADAARAELGFEPGGWWAHGARDRYLAVPTDVVAGCRLPARTPAAART
ncbi:MAG: pyridoxamine 5'-phosphate oxidase family protein [Acidimicrobiales bacterium]|nr:pyridoxamine 5'-phosphate oxidase family protein [Acidimicrobiales bacterium]